MRNMNATHNKTSKHGDATGAIPTDSKGRVHLVNLEDGQVMCFKLRYFLAIRAMINFDIVEIDDFFLMISDVDFQRLWESNFVSCEEDHRKFRRPITNMWGETVED